MAITDNWGYVKQATAGLLGLLMAQSVASAESKFLSLIATGFYLSMERIHQHLNPEGAEYA